MIVSHRFEFIFIKTHKTAGSTIEKALGPLCGPADIVPPMELKSPDPFNRNFYGLSLLSRQYGRSSLLRKMVPRTSPFIRPWFWEHMPAKDVQRQLPPAVWDTHWRFTVERNPWDKVVSYYLWKTQGQGKQLPSFKQYVLERSHKLPKDGDLYLDATGAPLVDEVLDFANFPHCFLDLCSRLQIPVSRSLPTEKMGARPGRRPYQEYYDSETRHRIAALYHREIELMGYKFDDPAPGRSYVARDRKVSLPLRGLENLTT